MAKGGLLQEKKRFRVEDAAELVRLLRAVDRFGMTPLQRAALPPLLSDAAALAQARALNYSSEVPFKGYRGGRVEAQFG